MAGPLDPVGWEVYESQQKREQKHREHIWKNAWLKIIRLVKKTSGFIGELENLRFGFVWKCWVWSRLEGKTPKGTTL